MERPLNVLGCDFASANILTSKSVVKNLKYVRYCFLTSFHSSDWKTYPQLFINGEFVGGCDVVTELFESGELKKMLEKAEVRKNGECLPLTAKELQLFQKLYENAGRIVTTGILCETICGAFWQGYESTLSTHIRHLREKIEADPSKPVSLVTAKGLGYRLNLKGAKS